MDYTLPTVATAAALPLGFNAATYLAQSGMAQKLPGLVNAAPYAGIAIPAMAALGSALGTRSLRDDDKFMTALGAAGGAGMGMIPYLKGTMNDSMENLFRSKKIQIPAMGRIGRGAMPLMGALLGGLGGYGLSRAFKKDEDNDEEEK